MKSLAATLLIALLAGCATAPGGIDKTYSAKGQASRVRFLVLHYTVSDRPASLKILTEQQVSAHYLLTDDATPTIYNLVDETRAAYHAGNSSWKGYTQLNNSSIGIEIVNAGWKDTPQGRVYAPFPQTQIDALIPLVKGIVQRHGILPENVIGHSDIAPLRKQDPGPMFPWYQLAQAGLVVWPDANRVALVRQVFDVQTPDALWFQKKLASHGFGLTQSGQFDPADQNRDRRFPDEIPPGEHRRRAGCGNGGPAGSADDAGECAAAAGAAGADSGDAAGATGAAAATRAAGDAADTGAAARPATDDDPGHAGCIDPTVTVAADPVSLYPSACPLCMGIPKD